MRDAIDRLWAEGGRRARSAPCGCSRRCSASCFPPAARSRARRRCASGERAVKAVYVHSHMDEETFDTERVVAVLRQQLLRRRHHHPGVQLQRAVPGEGGALHDRSRAAWNERSGRPAALPSLPVVRAESARTAPGRREALPGDGRLARAGPGARQGVRARGRAGRVHVLSATATTPRKRRARSRRPRGRGAARLPGLGRRRRARAAHGRRDAWRAGAASTCW